MEVSCVVVGEMCCYVDGLCKVTSKGGMWNCVDSSINAAVYEFLKMEGGGRYEVTEI